MVFLFYLVKKNCSEKQGAPNHLCALRPSIIAFWYLDLKMLLPFFLSLSLSCWSLLPQVNK